MSTPAGLRRTALLLAALAPADRRWALARLPAALRPALRRLSAEAQRLGLPADVVQEALQERPTAPSPAATEDDLAPLVPVLGSLPASWASRVLQAWSVSADKAEALLGERADLGSLRAELARPTALPPRLALALREASLRQASLAARVPGVERHG